MVNAVASVAATATAAHNRTTGGLNDIGGA
jgi:hypothetical protein